MLDLTIEKSFYPVSELSRMAACSEDDVLYYFDEYPLDLSISLHKVAMSGRSYGWVDGMDRLTARGVDYFIPPFDGLYELHIDQIRALHRGGHCEVERVFTDRGLCTVTLAQKLSIDRSDLFIRKEMAQRFLALIERRRGALEEESPGEENQYLLTDVTPVVMAAAPKQRMQEQRIVDMLKEQDHDPLNLPKRGPGRSGAKAEIRAIALLEPALFSKNSFDKAWDRLRKGGEIVGGE